MSRIGRKPINIPAGVTVQVDGNVVTVKGPKGTLTQKVHHNMNVSVEGNEVLVTRPDDEKENKSLHGLTRTLIHNMTIAIEPMINQGVKEVKTLADGWTTVTADGKLSAHFEHSVAITPEGPVILTLPD